MPTLLDLHAHGMLPMHDADSHEHWIVLYAMRAIDRGNDAHLFDAGEPIHIHDRLCGHTQDVARLGRLHVQESATDLDGYLTVRA